MVGRPQLWAQAFQGDPNKARLLPPLHPQTHQFRDSHTCFDSQEMPDALSAAYPSKLQLKLLRWPKSSLRFFHNILWKPLNLNSCPKRGKY